MNAIKLYAVHNGYEIIGYASNFEEIENTLIYQYSTLYLERFHATKKVEL